jgi:hypothetical protein
MKIETEIQPLYQLSERIKIDKKFYTVYSVLQFWSEDDKTLTIRYGLIRKNKYIRTLDEKQIKKIKRKKFF